MPGWHARTEPYRQSGKIKVLGIIQEQHPERCRLFMQWKQMDWPVAVDALNLLEVAAVPYTLLIDEAGVIRAINPKPEAFDAFLMSDPVAFEKTESSLISTISETAKDLETSAQQSNTAASWEAFGEHLFLWGADESMSQCVDAYTKAVALDSKGGWLHFRLGVAFRRLFDLDQKDMDLFRHAITQWQSALDLDPNQYIWRRRIQQYGPRLDKPYSFYDWIHQAREEISQRGDHPIPLTVEPSGAEFAYPDQPSDPGDNRTAEPDPDGRIIRDEQVGIGLAHTLVAATYEEKKAIRVHLKFQPNPIQALHWNNEAEPLTVWIQPTEGWVSDLSLLTFPNPRQATDSAPRSVEFEIVQTGEKADKTIRGYALYNVCEDINGVCMYRRQDFSIDLGSVGR